MNQSDPFGLDRMKSEQDVQANTDKISKFISPQGQFVKANAQKFLDAAYTELVSPETSPISKCMTLNVLKQLTYRAQTKVFSLMSVHKILEFMHTEARTVDPKKPIHEKGGKRFPESQDIGRQYMRTLLELVQAWGEKFAKGKNSEATRFKKNMIDLKNEGVVMPEEYIYVDINQIKSKAKKVSKDNLGSSQRDDKKPVSTTPNPSGGSSLRSELRFTRDKINLYFDDLEEEEDPDQVNKNIQKNHDFFTKELSKYEQKMTSLESQNLGQQEIEYFFKVYEFLQLERDIYGKNITKNRDAKSYIDELKIASQKYGGFTDNPFDKNQKVSPPPPPTTSKKPSNDMENYASNSSNYKVQNPPEQKKINKTSDVKVLKKDILNSVYERFADRSKSPDVGFKNVQKQLQKEKEIAKRNPLRSTSRSPKPINRSGLGVSRSSNNLKESKVSAIFSNPPNTVVSSKNFEGNLIPSNRQLGKIVFNIKKQQGIKRFKTSNFKERSPLFENDHIQVGYKSQSLYQSINGFTQFIFLNIFVGNKTQQNIKDFQVEYKGDANQLLYANPKNVDSIIPSGYQNKHDLLITPLRVPFSLITMHISYRFQNSEIMTSIVLPNSVLKFASYMKITRQQLWQSWRDSQKYKTNSFQLCTSLPPDSFNKYIPALEYLTEYSQFAAPNSQTDLQMFCKIIMLQKYEAILKIIVRPNLTVILQVGSLQSSRQATEYFTFYLQSLELVMKQISI